MNKYWTSIKEQWAGETAGPGLGAAGRLETAAVLLAAFGLFALYQFQSDFLSGTDPFYHIKFAWLTRTQGFLREFPWAHLSLWRDHFCDKEFLYHVYLIPFTFFNNLETGAKYAAALMAAGVLASFFAILRLNKAAWPWLWTFLLMSSGGYFLFRVNQVRPQGLSILLSLWALHFLINRRYMKFAAVAFVYTWSYTAFHLPLMYALIWAAPALLLDRRLELKAPLAALGALLAGMVIHPYFPENIKMFWLQNFYVLYQASYGRADLHMGGEFAPMNTRSMAEVLTAVIIPYCAALFAAVAAPRKADEKTRGVFLVALAMIFLTLYVKRFAEYSVPFTLLFCALYFTPYKEELSPLRLLKAWPRLGSLALAGGALLLAGLFYRSWQDTAPQYRDGETALKGPALYLAEHAPEGEVVFTCDWDDAPDLFYYNHRNRYLVFLDPNFMYAMDRNVWEWWHTVANGEFGDYTHDVLRTKFNARWGVCTSDFSALRGLMAKDKRFEIPYDNGRAWVFRVKD